MGLQTAVGYLLRLPRTLFLAKLWLLRTSRGILPLSVTGSSLVNFTQFLIRAGERMADCVFFLLDPFCCRHNHNRWVHFRSIFDNG